ncbi:hypothetical protein DH2020_012246 [Rehmannia glutinosa]|uniref:Saccharopine dehydrogenase-like protein n=1 Tax=Rehmannia glutinosa TaxID=99300 RepID=A0ABR0X1W5_REHGL
MERMEALYHEKVVEKGSLVISAWGLIRCTRRSGTLFHSGKWVGPSVEPVEAYRAESDKKIVGNFGAYESLFLGVANAHKLLELRKSRLNRPASGSIIEHQKQLGLWALKLPSADSTVVRRTLTTLTQNPHGLPGVNETPKNIKNRETFWSSIKPAHFGVKLGSKALLGLFPAIVLGIFIGLLSKIALGRRLLLKFPSFFSLGWFRKNGPSEAEVASATFKMWFVGHGFSDADVASSRGNKKPDTEIVTRVMGPEVGYLTTPIILIQCALILLADRDSLPKGGVLTPGIVFGPTDLQERLQANGISFDFVSKNAL